MTYATARNVKIGDMVVCKCNQNKMIVLDIEKDTDGNNLFFRCIFDGKELVYHHTAVSVT